VAHGVHRVRPDNPEADLLNGGTALRLFYCRRLGETTTRLFKPVFLIAASAQRNVVVPRDRDRGSAVRCRSCHSRSHCGIAAAEFAGLLQLGDRAAVRRMTIDIDDPRRGRAAG